MVEFTQSVQLRHRIVAQNGGLTETVTANYACVVREETEFADDFFAVRQKLTLLLPGNATVMTGDSVTLNGKSYQVVGVRLCRNVADSGHVLRIQAIG